MIRKIFKKKLVALVIEDDNHIKKLVSKYLELCKFKVHTAANGAEALSLLETIKPELIVTDLMMGKMSGVEFIKEYKKENNKTPIIVITGAVDKVTDKLVNKWNDIKLIKKPFRASELLEIIKTMFNIKS